MKTLKLFNAVIAGDSNAGPFVSKAGFIIEPEALWAKDAIIRYFKNENLDGYGLNKTFHKSWRTILNSSREKLWMEQICHYISTYGSGFKDEVYIPNELLDLPDVQVKFKVIRAYSKEEMTNKCLAILQSGIALKGETVDDILSVLHEDLVYDFTGEEGIRNKEAIVKIAEKYDVLPKDPSEFLRFIVYKATGETLLIKSNELIQAIEDTYFNPANHFEQFGLEKLAKVFNRFKPLFLAFKSQCPKTINKISKLSKKHHAPMTVNPLNAVTTVLLSEEDYHWLDKATPFALFRALSACYTRMKGQYSFTYRIRNGKSFVKNNRVSGAVWANYYYLLEYLKGRFDLSGKKLYIPTDVEYALPTSEKMYVGNIPTGSKFYGKSLAVGVYWENSWGAYDLDLSGLNIGGKVGWNSSYKQGKGVLMYSGDMTDAQNGAVEYLYAQNGLAAPTLINNNVFGGRPDCEYKIIVGKGDDVNYDYMMNPENLFVEAKSASVQRQSVLGMLIPEKNKQCFVLLNFGAGECRVSGNTEISDKATNALYQQWSNAITFNELVTELGGEIVKYATAADYDFSLDKLEKDSLMKVFA
ncbi:MAG: hypothetical protein AAFQ94_22300 [Bacteroidota bacterium]